METVLLEDLKQGSEQQKSVDTYFHSRAAYWKELYKQNGVHATIIQQRRDVVLAFVDTLALCPESPILEVGCGAGVTAVALAERGHVVAAVDTVDAMINLTRQLAAEKGVGQRVVAGVGDAHRLPFPDNTFNLLLAIGVMPWVHSLNQSLREMVRVLKPGGYLIVTAENRSYVGRTVLGLVGTVLRGIRLLKARNQPPLRYCSTTEFDALLSEVGLEKSESRTVGFWIVSYVPERARMIVHRKLQSLADRGVPLIRSAGINYVVLARKLNVKEPSPHHSLA